MKTIRKPYSQDYDSDKTHPLNISRRILEYLSSKQSGALYGKWDFNTSTGVLFYSKDTLAMFEKPDIDEILYEDTVLQRFRSVIFRIGSFAAENEGDLCGVFKFQDEEGGKNNVKYRAHASFHPEAGIWLKIVIVKDSNENE